MDMNTRMVVLYGGAATRFASDLVHILTSWSGYCGSEEEVAPKARPTTGEWR
jgi:hypothetical protein